MVRALIGTSGFSYDHWRGVFYPQGLSKNRWLGFYAQHFPTVELNVTFYRLPSESAFNGWKEQTPNDFRFALKGPRQITHVKKLKDVADQLAVFFARTSILGNKRSVVLWQLPPEWKLNIERLEEFSNSLEEYRVRSALELRNRSWFDARVYDILKSHNIAIALADHPFNVEGSSYDVQGKETIKVPQTADFAYIRAHGPSRMYASLYDKEAIRRYAKMIRYYLNKRMDVYAYFNNDLEGYALENARELLGML